MELTMYKMDGKEGGKITLSDDLFAVKVNPALVHEAIVIQEANYRTRYAQTKDRSEVRGGGRKPWKQKGTGRARHGSRRSPIWSGGGVTFGPTNLLNFSKKMNKRAKRKALKMVLSDKVHASAFIVVEDLKIDEVKTKFIDAMLKALPTKDGSSLIVVGPEDANVKLAARNIPKTDAISAESLNIRDIVKYKYLIVSKDAVEVMTKLYSK